jgi:hypothetical protein
VPKSAGVQYLALLRGINVGGQNVVKMAGLRLAFEELGFADVATYSHDDPQLEDHDQAPRPDGLEGRGRLSAA